MCSQAALFPNSTSLPHKRCLPQELGSCSRLVKLQASFNRLASLPPQLASLPRLELMRVAVNCLPEVTIPPPLQYYHHLIN